MREQRHNDLTAVHLFAGPFRFAIRSTGLNVVDASPNLLATALCPRGRGSH